MSSNPSLASTGFWNGTPTSTPPPSRHDALSAAGPNERRATEYGLDHSSMACLPCAVDTTGNLCGQQQCNAANGKVTNCRFSSANACFSAAASYTPAAASAAASAASYQKAPAAGPGMTSVYGQPSYANAVSSFYANM